MLPDDLEPMAIAKADCFTLRPTEAAYPPYLMLQLASPSSHRNLVADIHGATRPRINTTQLRNLPIALCSLAEQHEIVSRFRELNALADQLSTRIETAGKSVARSSQAVLAKAFAVTLCTQSSRQRQHSPSLQEIRPYDAVDGSSW